MQLDHGGCHAATVLKSVGSSELDPSETHSAESKLTRGSASLCMRLHVLRARLQTCGRCLFQVCLLTDQLITLRHHHCTSCLTGITPDNPRNHLQVTRLSSIRLQSHDAATALAESLQDCGSQRPDERLPGQHGQTHTLAAGAPSLPCLACAIATKDSARESDDPSY